MSVAFAIASGSSLTSRNEPTPFTATLPVIAISVSVPISQSLSLEERAWRDGAFLYPYLRSTKNGNTYTLVRDGGWPQVYDSLGKLRPIAVYVDEDVSGGQGGNLNPVPGFEAWYVLDPIRKLVDQTGNAHTLSGSGTNVAGPNLGMVAQTSLGLTEAVASAVWRTNGAISLVALVNIAASAGDRWFASCELVGPRNTWWKFGLSSNGKPFYGVDNKTANTGQGVEWGPVLPTSGWHTFGFSRAADGLSLKAYLDGGFVGTATASVFPEGGSGSVLTVGKDLFASVQAYNQQCTAIALSELSEAQMSDLAARIQGAT